MNSQDFTDYLLSAMGNECVLEQCALNHHLVLPAQLVLQGYLVRANRQGSIQATTRVADYIATSKDYGQGKLVRWGVINVELTMEADFDTVAKTRRFDPPANGGFDLCKEKVWWHNALSVCAQLVCCVQKVQFAKAPRCFQKWQDIPLIIWAKPFAAKPVRPRESDSSALHNIGPDAEGGGLGWPPGGLLPSGWPPGGWLGWPPGGWPPSGWPPGGW